MTWFYVCRDCGETKAFGSAGKGAIQVVKVYGECCYSIEDEIQEINDWRKKQGLDQQESKLNKNPKGSQ